MEDGLNEITSCDVSKLKCNDCVWGYVVGLRPTDISCGKFRRKPASIYYRGKNCPMYRPFKKEGAEE
jgi:hypothetical protein